jgi:Mg2+/Co2+ transporter CorB
VKNAVEKCEEIVNQLVYDGFLCAISKDELRGVIKRATKQSDQRTIKSRIEDLLDFGYITQQTPKIYKLNITKEVEQTGKQLKLLEAVRGTET